MLKFNTLLHTFLALALALMTTHSEAESPVKIPVILIGIASEHSISLNEVERHFHAAALRIDREIGIELNLIAAHSMLDRFPSQEGIFISSSLWESYLSQEGMLTPGTLTIVVDEAIRSGSPQCSLGGIASDLCSLDGGKGVAYMTLSNKVSDLVNQQLMAHEIGHLVGMTHINEAKNVMQAFFSIRITEDFKFLPKSLGEASRCTDRDLESVLVSRLPRRQIKRFCRKRYTRKKGLRRGRFRKCKKRYGV